MKRTSKFVVFKDAAGEWRWQLLASNGKIVADSGEGYKRKASAEKAVEKFKTAVLAAPIVQLWGREKEKDAKG